MIRKILNDELRSQDINDITQLKEIMSVFRGFKKNYVCCLSVAVSGKRLSLLPAVKIYFKKS